VPKPNTVYSLLSGDPRFPKLCPFNRGVRSRGIFFLICNTYDVYYNLSLVSDYDENKTENVGNATSFAFDLGPDKGIFLFLAFTKHL
jgi:hypothetical protein